MTSGRHCGGRIIGEPKTVAYTVLAVAVCALLSGCRTFYGVPSPPPETAVRISPGIPVIPDRTAQITVPSATPGIPTVAAPSLPAAPGIPAVAAPSLPTAPPAAPAAPSAAVPVSPLTTVPANSQLNLTPQKMVAPVGSEVVLLAGLIDPNGRPMTNQRVEWMLSPDSVGHFVTVGQNNGLLSFGRRPQKVDNSYAIGNTSSRAVTLTRGTPAQIDDVAVQRGQAWISISSPSDGTTQVTAFAPGVIGWDRRQQTSTIYWVDALFSFPAPAIAAVGTRQTFNSIVTRSSDGSPIEGYLVRYTITDGPAAGFAPDGSTSVELVTGSEGQASIEIFQATPARGVNTIQVEVIRPATAPGSDRRLVVGRGTTTMNWTAPEVTLTVTGPSEAQVGGTVTNRIDVVNSGDLPLTSVVVTNRVPEGLSYQTSSVQPDTSPSGLEWRLGILGPGQTQSIDVTYTVTQGQTFENCAVVNTAEGVSAENCLAMSATLPTVELQVTGPSTAAVGQEVTFALSITNRNNSPVTGLIIRDTFDEGLEHAVADSPIERELGTLQPGQTRNDIGLTFRVARPGQICHTVEIRGAGIRSAERRICITAQAAPAQPPQPTPEPGLRVAKSGPASARVGDLVMIELLVTNTGNTTLNNVEIVDTYERGLEPVRVSEGYQIRNGELIWNYDSLAPSESRRLQVECRCDRAVRACSRATVTAGDDFLRVDETCVVIAEAAQPPGTVQPPRPVQPPPEVPAIPPDGGSVPPSQPAPGAVPAGQALRVSISDLSDEVAVGSNVIYEVNVTNLRQVVDANVALTVIVPPGMTPVRTGITAFSQWNMVGQTIQFNPIAELRPGETLPYRIPLRADRAGKFRVEARATSNAQPQPAVAAEETNVFNEG